MRVAAGTLEQAPEPPPLSEGPAAFTRVVSGRARSDVTSWIFCTG